MNVVGTLVLDASGPSGACSYERVLRLVEARAPRLAPFRRRMVAMPFGLDHPVWVDDPALEVRSHVERVRAPAPGSDRVLGNLVADGLSAALLMLQLLDSSPGEAEGKASEARMQPPPAPTSLSLLAHAASRPYDYF